MKISNECSLCSHSYADNKPPIQGIGSLCRRFSTWNKDAREACGCCSIATESYLNRKSIPLCFNIALAVCRDFIFVSTVMWRLVMGLYQISWSPFPCRVNVQLFCIRTSRTFFSYSAITKPSFHDAQIKR